VLPLVHPAPHDAIGAFRIEKTGILGETYISSRFMRVGGPIRSLGAKRRR
jgi:hypothetical protein